MRARRCTRRPWKASTDSQAYLQAKLRNAEIVEAMGMLGNLRRLWLQVHERQLHGQAVAFEYGAAPAGADQVPAVHAAVADAGAWAPCW